MPLDASPRILGLSMPLPSAPMVDLRTGAPTRQWIGFLSTLLARTGGTAPISATLPQVATMAQDGPPDGALLAALLSDAEAGIAVQAAPLGEDPAPGALLAALLADPDAATASPAPVPAPTPGLLAIQATAGAAISGHRALAWDGAGGVIHADPSLDSYEFAGLSAQAAQAGALVLVVQSGLVAEPTWAWTPGQPVFVGAEGVLTQTPPVAGVLQQIGVAASATSLLVQPLYPITLQ